MQRIGNLREDFLSFENLQLAFGKAFRGTRNHTACKFAFHLEKEIFKLQDELATGAYMPGEYRYMVIETPKKRTIAIASFRDRVVHHALHNVLEGIYEKRFIYDSYATRKEKGTHKAIKRAQVFMRKTEWYLKMDIRKYFASINHEILMGILQRTVKDTFIIELCGKIIHMGGDGMTGLPIGNLTSQFFANVYLDILDHHAKDHLRMKCYLRYMDDFCFFSNDKQVLKDLKNSVTEYLWSTLKLLPKESATLINDRIHGLPYLGVHIWPNMIRVKKENFNLSFEKLKRREWELKHGYINYEEYQASQNSLISHLSYWGNNLLKNKLLKGSVSEAACI
jgi:retron-type reverse transcriptase